MTLANRSTVIRFDVRGISCRRGNRQVLHGVDMQANAGQIIGLVGANGAGKTTFFDVVCGLRAPQPGGLNHSIPAERIAYLTQSITVPDALRLGELAELVFGLSGRRGARKFASKNLSDKARAKFLMLWDRRSNSCSYGEKRWFVLVVVLATDADLFILDEPTAGVDIEYRHYIWQAIKLMRDQGKMVIFSTHVASEIEDVCDCFYFLKEGWAERFDSTQAFLTATQATTLEGGFINYLTTDFAETTTAM